MWYVDKNNMPNPVNSFVIHCATAQAALDMLKTTEILSSTMTKRSTVKQES